MKQYKRDRLSMVRCINPDCRARLTYQQVWGGQETCSASCGQRLRWGPAEDPVAPSERDAPPMTVDPDMLAKVRRDREVRELMEEETSRTGRGRPARGMTFREQYGIRVTERRTG